MILVVACCAALAAGLAVRKPVVATPRRARVTRRPGLSDPHVLRAVSVALGLVFAVAWGGFVGLAVGVLIALLLPLGLGRLEPRALRARRAAIARQSASAADLLAACLSSGAPLPASMSAVAEAMGEPVAAPLRLLVSSLDLGTDPAIAWQAMAQETALSPIALAAARSSESGAPLSDLLRDAAGDMRRAQRARADAAARASGVKAVGPLAACFLPAFLLLGIVPVVVSLALPLTTGGLP